MIKLEQYKGVQRQDNHKSPIIAEGVSEEVLHIT